MGHATDIDWSADSAAFDYDSRRYDRLILSSGGYVVPCQIDNVSSDALRPPLRMNICDLNIRGVGLIGKVQLRVGDRLIIPSPQNFLMHANVVRCIPDPIFPHLYRIGLIWGRYPPVNVFLQWESFLLTPQLPAFHEQVAIIDGILS